MDEALSFIWSQEAENVIADKVDDLEKYQIQLQNLFKTHAVKGSTEEDSQQDATMMGA